MFHTHKHSIQYLQSTSEKAACDAGSVTQYSISICTSLSLVSSSCQVAVCVVCYGVSETVFGEWSVMGSTIILVHSYYNVWLRAQLGWQSFLLRRDAVNKIKSLPTASNTQLEQYNDICAICYQVRALESISGFMLKLHCVDFHLIHDIEQSGFQINRVHKEM